MHSFFRLLLRLNPLLLACDGGLGAPERRVALFRHTVVGSACELHPGSVVRVNDQGQLLPGVVCQARDNYGHLLSLERLDAGPLSLPRELILCRVPYFDLIGPHPGRSPGCQQEMHRRTGEGYGLAEVESVIYKDGEPISRELPAIGVRLYQLPGVDSSGSKEAAF